MGCVTFLQLWASLALLCANTDSGPSCSTKKCRSNENPVYYPKSESYCQMSGDRHYRTFDGHLYDFQGICTYTVAKTSNDKSLPYFNVEAKSENRGNTRMASVGQLNIQVHDYNISLVRNEYEVVKVNNQPQRLPLSLSEGKVKVYQSGVSIVLTTDFELTITFDLDDIKINIPRSFSEKVSGLCGNCNGNPSDDMMKKTGIQARSLDDFGSSWKVEDGDSSCSHTCNGEYKTCPPDTQQLFSNEGSCGLLSLADGPFRQCHSIIDHKRYLDDCVYDLCMNSGSKQILCQNLKAYADICERNKVEIEEWRSLSGCPNTDSGPSCSTKKCRSNENPVYYPKSEYYCQMSGDRHYRTFDGHLYDFQGTCTYTVAKTSNDKSLPYFNVEAKSENRGNTRMASVGQLNIQVYDYNISLVRNEYEVVKVNNQPQRLPLSLSEGKVKLLQSGVSIFIRTDFELTITFNDDIKINIPHSFSERVSGLCGNCNGNPSDDMMKKTGIQARSLDDFASSWKVEDGDSSCSHTCNGEYKTCPPDTQLLFSNEGSCGLLSLADGPFRQCHSIIDHKRYLDDCVYDLCMNSGSKQILCQNLKAYADICERNKVEIEEWRSLSGCLPE